MFMNGRAPRVELETVRDAIGNVLGVNLIGEELALKFRVLVLLEKISKLLEVGKRRRGEKGIHGSLSLGLNEKHPFLPSLIGLPFGFIRFHLLMLIKVKSDHLFHLVQAYVGKNVRRDQDTVLGLGETVRILLDDVEDLCVFVCIKPIQSFLQRFLPASVHLVLEQQFLPSSSYAALRVPWSLRRLP